MESFCRPECCSATFEKEERVIDFMVQFGKRLGLSTIVDEVGNVIIKKPASKGMEDRQTIVMQSHLDMVHQKNGVRHQKIIPIIISNILKEEF